MNDIKILAITVQGSEHVEKKLKKAWLDEIVSECKKNSNNKNVYDIEIISFSYEDASYLSRIQNKISEYLPDIIFMTGEKDIKKFIEEDYLNQKECLVFWSDQWNYDDEKVLDSNIFYSYSAFSSSKSINFLLNGLNSNDLLLIFDEEDEDFAKTVKSKVNKEINSKILIIKNEFISDDSEHAEKKELLKWNYETGIVDKGEGFDYSKFDKLKNYISAQNLNLSKDFFVAGNLSQPDFAISMFALKELYGINMYSLVGGTKAYIPKGTVEYSEFIELSPNYKALKHSLSLDANINLQDQMCLRSFNEIIYDPLFLLDYLTSKHNLDKLPRDVFFKSLKDKLMNMKSENDFFIGRIQTFSFDKNFNVFNEFYFYKKEYTEELNKSVPIYFKYQKDNSLILSEKPKILKTWYIYLDLISIKEIDISKGLWFGEFELDLIAPVENAFQYINFHNNSPLDNLWDVKKVSEFEIDSKFQSKYRIHASFDFIPNANDYPFDIQDINIEFSLEETIKDGILQPTPLGYVDTDFKVEGWNLVSSLGGINRKKVFERKGANLETYPVQRKSIINEWKMKRKAGLAAVKSFIPLYILLFLSWYGSFLDIGEATTAVSLNATVFLAGIALYFSADRPETNVLTLIDKVFILFYASIALLIASEFTIFISENFYNVSHFFWQISIPFLASISIFYIYRKIYK